jgi:hypothetical protein
MEAIPAKFALKYAPSLGMFNQHAGKEGEWAIIQAYREVDPN